MHSGSRQLISQENQSQIENANVPRAKFLNRWTRKTTFDQGYLVPILLDEVLPGDHLSYEVTAYLRMATPLFPMFDNLRVDTHFFFVPNRLVWDNWVKMMGEQDSPADSTSFNIPIILLPVGGHQPNTIFDHMGIPGLGQINVAEQIQVNALPFRAYNLIYNQWFRDENVQNGLTILKNSGPDASTLYSLQRRAKSHDYFTSALPWPQKSVGPAVPLSGLAPVTGLGRQTNVGGAALGANRFETMGAVNYAFHQQFDATWSVKYGGNAVGNYPLIYADLAQTAGIAINTLRQAFLVQQLLERDARGGTRYTELIRSHFGVINPDFRLQRPEYIGGGQSPLNITPIAQTAPTAGVPLGAIGGAGTAAGQHRASFAATEHGHILGLISVRSELSYQQGLEKLWSRYTKYDFYWPTLAGLGEQAILTKELYVTGVGAADNTVFGYQERWQEYRTKQSDVTGMMRSTTTGTLDMWHLSQKFLAAPVLNSAFIEDNAPMSRVLAAGALAVNQQFLADIMFQRTAVRPIPSFGTPVTLGRF